MQTNVLHWLYSNDTMSSLRKYGLLDLAIYYTENLPSVKFHVMGTTNKVIIRKPLSSYLGVTYVLSHKRERRRVSAVTSFHMTPFKHAPSSQSLAAENTSHFETITSSQNAVADASPAAANKCNGGTKPCLLSRPCLYSS